MNDYELLECDVQWPNGEEDTVLLTELVFEGCRIEISWKHDPERRGKIGTVFDFATVAVKWQGCNAKIVDLKDHFLSNGDKFFNKIVQRKEDVCCEGKVTRVAESRKKLRSTTSTTTFK